MNFSYKINSLLLYQSLESKRNILLQCFQMASSYVKTTQVSYTKMAMRLFHQFLILAINLIILSKQMNGMMETVGNLRRKHTVIMRSAVVIMSFADMRWSFSPVLLPKCIQKELRFKCWQWKIVLVNFQFQLTTNELIK